MREENLTMLPGLLMIVAPGIPEDPIPPVLLVRRGAIELLLYARGMSSGCGLTDSGIESLLFGRFKLDLYFLTSGSSLDAAARLDSDWALLSLLFSSLRIPCGGVCCLVLSGSLMEAVDGDKCTSSALGITADLRLPESVDLTDRADRRDRLRSRLFVRSSELRMVSTANESRFLGKTVSAAFRSSSDSDSDVLFSTPLSSLGSLSKTGFVVSPTPAVYSASATTCEISAGAARPIGALPAAVGDTPGSPTAACLLAGVFPEKKLIAPLLSRFPTRLNFDNDEELAADLIEALSPWDLGEGSGGPSSTDEKPEKSLIEGDDVMGWRLLALGLVLVSVMVRDFDGWLRPKLGGLMEPLIVAARSGCFFLLKEKAFRNFWPNESFSGVIGGVGPGARETEARVCTVVRSFRLGLGGCAELLLEWEVLTFMGTGLFEFKGVWKSRVGVWAEDLLLAVLIPVLARGGDIDAERDCCMVVMEWRRTSEGSTRGGGNDGAGLTEAAIKGLDFREVEITLNNMPKKK